MFTGIVEEKGKIRRISSGGVSAAVEISACKVLEGTKLGDSIACLLYTSPSPRDS